MNGVESAAPVNSVEPLVCDATYIFNNFWRTEKFKNAMRDSTVYKNNEAPEHKSFKDTLDVVIDSAISIDSQSGETQSFYLSVIDYLINQCPGHKMKLYERTTEEDSRKDPVEIVITSPVGNQLQGKDLNNIHLLLEARKQHNGDYPFKVLSNSIGTFVDNLNTNVTTLESKISEDQKYETEKKETEILIDHLTQFKTYITGLGAEE